TSRENQIGFLFFDVQSDENAFFKVFKVPKAIGIPLDNLDQIVSSFEFGIRVRYSNGVDAFLLILSEGSKHLPKDWMHEHDIVFNELKEVISAFHQKDKQ